MSQFLPEIYTIRGLRAAQGFVFKDPLTAKQWLKEQGLTEIPFHIQILPATVIYYGSNLTVDFT